MSKNLVGPKGKFPKVLGWFLRVLSFMLNVCMVCFRRFHFLNVTLEVESYHSGLSSHVYPGWPVAWADVVGGCYRVASEHGSPLGLDGLCVGHSCMLVSCVSLTLAFHVLVSFA